MQLAAKFFIEEHLPEDAIVATDSDVTFLREIVEEIAHLRHIHENFGQNLLTQCFIADHFRLHCGFCISHQGNLGNVVGGWGDENLNGKHVIGAHFDGPLGSPGADDNASAIAVLCLLAKKLKNPPKDLLLVAFNGEEVGMLGSREFVNSCSPRTGVILEMVGYYSSEEGSQSMPPELPQYSKGDFLGIVGNRHSNGLGAKLLTIAQRNELALPMKSLQIPFGLETKVPGLSHTCRSDHAPFWEKGIPAVMLTDTAEFRNKNYHMPTDLPDTLDYPAMAELVRLLELYVETLED